MSSMNNGDAAPMVSAIIPAYNASAFIRESIESVLDQDYPNIEVIVVNDGSTDSTSAILSSYENRIRQIDQQNGGAAAARNAGLAQSRGEYICFLDADDVWLPGKVTTQVAYLEQNPDIDLVQGRWHEWRPSDNGSGFPAWTSVVSLPSTTSGELPSLVSERSGWVYHRLLTGFILCTDVVMLRRRLVEQVGKFRCDLDIGEDFDYWLRASRHTRVATLDRPMALYRQHSASTTQSCPDRNYAAEVLDQAISTWGTRDRNGSRADPAQLRRHRARLWKVFAYKQLQAGNPLGASVSCTRAARFQPVSPAVWKLFLASMLVAAGILRSRGPSEASR